MTKSIPKFCKIKHKKEIKALKRRKKFFRKKFILKKSISKKNQVHNFLNAHFQIHHQLK
jgi:hypothetical protein